MSADMKKAFPGVTIEQRGDPVYNSPTRVYFSGMDLRDYFAAKAMQAFFSNNALNDNHSTYHEMSKEAYMLADAMLQEREK